GTIAMRFGWTGPNLCVATACAASANAIGEAARLIRYGEADVILAGGAECSITPTAIGAFARMTALSTRNDDPGRASRPFDADRDGSGTPDRKPRAARRRHPYRRRRGLTACDHPGTGAFELVRVRWPQREPDPHSRVVTGSVAIAPVAIGAQVDAAASAGLREI